MTLNPDSLVPMIVKNYDISDKDTLVISLVKNMMGEKVFKKLS